LKKNKGDRFSLLGNSILKNGDLSRTLTRPADDDVNYGSRTDLKTVTQDSLSLTGPYEDNALARTVEKSKFREVKNSSLTRTAQNLFDQKTASQ